MKGYIYQDEDEVFANSLLEMANGDSKKVIMQLLQRIRILEADIENSKKRNVKQDLPQEIEHLISFLKTLDHGMKPTWEPYQQYLTETAQTAIGSRAKFDGLIQQAIDTAIYNDLPKHFTYQIAKDVANEWRLSDYLDKTLSNELLFIKLPEQLPIIEKQGDAPIMEDVFCKLL